MGICMFNFDKYQFSKVVIVKPYIWQAGRLEMDKNLTYFSNRAVVCSRIIWAEFKSQFTQHWTARKTKASTQTLHMGESNGS